MKRIYLLLVPALLLTACSKKDKAHAEADAAPVVDVAQAVTDSVTLYRTYPGTIHAASHAAVVCRVNGTLVSQNYKGGDMVRKGQVLFTIDGSTYRNNLAEAEAALATAESNNRYAESHYEAVARAFTSNAVSQMEVNQALSNRDQSRAAIKNAQAALTQAQQDLEKCTIRAPFDGRITSCIYSVGAYISGEGNPVELATIYDDANVEAYFYIEDASFQRMFSNGNNRHLIDYDAVPLGFAEQLPHEYTGALFYIAPSVDTSTGSLLVKCSIKNTYGELRDGMYVTIDMPYKVEPDALLVRDASLSTDQLGKYLYVVNDSNQVVYTPVKVSALVNDSMRVVESGLKPGSRYVTSALLKVRDGMTVKPKVINSNR